MYNCAKCFQRGCTKQDMTKTLPDCPSKDEQVKEQAKQLYNEPENHRIAYCAALTEAGGYCQDTRLIEIIKFLHRGGYHKIGIAFCTGLFKETQEVVNILEYNGFEVVSIICKNGSITKDFGNHRRAGGPRQLQNRNDVQSDRTGAVFESAEDRLQSDARSVCRT